MSDLRPKFRALCHAINIEALLVVGGYLVHVGPCGPSNAASFLLLLLLFILHGPGMMIGGLAFIPARLVVPSMYGDWAVLEASVAFGNVAFLTWAVYAIMKRRRRTGKLMNSL